MLATAPRARQFLKPEVRGNSGANAREECHSCLPEASALSGAGRTRRLAAWFDAANRTRALLRTTVRADLAIAELLLAWQETR